MRNLAAARPGKNPTKAREAIGAATPGATCTGGIVTIRETDAGFEFRYAQGDRAATHRVASIAQAGAWLESWLLPLAGPAPRPQPELQAAPVPA